MRDISKRTRIILFLAYFWLCMFYVLFTKQSFLAVVGQAFSVAITFLLFFRFWPKVKKSRLANDKRGVIRVLTVFVLSIVILAFTWYFTDQFFTQFADTHDTLVSDLGTNSTTQELVKTFFVNLNDYALVLSIIIVGYWCLQKSQKKGEPVVYG